MPPGAPYHGFIRPYSIRVDEFTTPSDDPTFVPPALHLLTHTHSDHLTGLAAKSFASKVWCSHDAKEMLLRLEPYKERKLKDSDIREDKKLAKAYQHLKVSPQVVDGRKDYHGSRDLLVRLLLCISSDMASEHEGISLTPVCLRVVLFSMLFR